MKKKNYKRLIGTCTTVGELVKQLKTNFDPEDQINVCVLACLQKGAAIDPETNFAGFTLHAFTNTLQNLYDARKEKQ